MFGLRLMDFAIGEGACHFKHKGTSKGAYLFARVPLG